MILNMLRISSSRHNAGSGTAHYVYWTPSYEHICIYITNSNLHNFLKIAHNSLNFTSFINYE